ncbi:ribosome biogenesis GTPase Der [Emcibacter sp. SYSU 3D8]|uniref:ribosome biogenesis GTPase Der n=1 Tax=Emcibacter sp. SYSU 3D8 TaxID=3133969 RepID=UPI0031FE7259
MSFTAAIIGRPNVGKSTLFNRLTGRRLALVDDRPGVTRDRREADARIAGLEFKLIDTAGLEDVNDDSMEARMRHQTELAVESADVVMFMIDARAGITPLDEHFAQWLRETGKPVVVVANKSEGSAGESGYLEAFGLGLGTPVQISAEHGQGMGELYDALSDHAEIIIPNEDDEDGVEHEDGVLHLAIIGRPNAGKSTLINTLIGEERLLAGPEAGLTRDSISVEWEYDGKRIKLFDTAGMRRKARVIDKLERMSVADGLRAVKFAQIVVLLVDATSPLDRQDRVLANLVAREGRALVVALNKWDLVENKKDVLKEVEDMLDLDMPEIRGVQLVQFSALTGRGLDKLMPAVMKAYEAWDSRISTARLNRWLDASTQAHPPPAPAGRRLKLRYMTQVKARPPTFVCFCSRPDEVPESYIRYMQNGLRDTFDMWGTPIRIRLKKSDNPFADKD